MGIARGQLDRRIEIWRSVDVDNGTATIAGEPALAGKRWARKVDVSDAERMRAGENASSLTTRFLVGSDPLTRSISGKDTVRYKGRTFAVTGTKEVGDRRDGIEITAAARPDQAS